MKINDSKIVKRWNSVMDSICCEYMTINTRLSEIEHHSNYYGIENGITVDWLIGEAEYWLSCYHEEGNVRHDLKYEDRSMWYSETGKLKRLIDRLKSMDKNFIVAEW